MSAACGEKASQPPEDIWDTIIADLQTLGVNELWAELRGLREFRGGDQKENLRLAALVETLAVRDDEGDASATGARSAFEAWKEGGGDSGHIVPWMLNAAPPIQA